jgi:hypothetical protein
MPFACDNEDGNDAAMFFTMAETAETMRLCGECIPSYVKVLADATGVPAPEGGTISAGQLMQLATGREIVIDTIKGSKPVRDARLAELETVITAINALINGEPLPEGTMPQDDDPSDEDELPEHTPTHVDQMAEVGASTRTDSDVDYGDQGTPPY